MRELPISDLSLGRAQRFSLAHEATGALQPMGAGEVAAWAEHDDPAEAVAIFPPTEPQSWPATGYARASFDYLDSRGRIVNTIAPTGAVATSEYNEDNEVERSLSPANRLAALEHGAQSAEYAERLSTQSEYNPEGTELLETLGPEHEVKLATALGSHKAGEMVPARSLTEYDYDEGAPSGEEFGLETKVSQGLVLASGETGEERETTTSYSGQNNLGWKLREPTSVTSDPSGLALTSSTIYYVAGEEEGIPKMCEKHPSLEGQICETRAPMGQGGESARDGRSVYYTAEANSDHSSCGEHAKWQGLVCETLPDKQPSDKPALAETKVVSYNIWSEPLETVEEFGTAKRTTGKTYDAAGRETESKVESAAGKTLPRIKRAYSETTGALETETSEGASEATRTITSKLNRLGALESYTDAAGATSTYEYEPLGRLTKVKEGVNAKGEGKDEQTYSYEPLTGELTGLVDSDVGPFEATYDLEGKMTSETYPNGMVATYAYNSTGETTSLEYDKGKCSGTGCTIYVDTVDSGIHGESLSEESSSEKTSQGQSAGESMTYAYDPIGRLEEVREVPAEKNCTTRLYSYDGESNRTKLTTRESGSSQCTTSGGSEQEFKYDEANRLTGSEVTYDELANATKVPAADAGGQPLTSTYYADSQLASQTQSETVGGSQVARTLEYEYDPAGRTLMTKTKGGSTSTSHYAGPGSTPAWTSEGPKEEACTLEIPGIDGSLAAVQKLGEAASLQVDDLKGDVVGTITDKAGEYALGSTYDATEFGVPTKEDVLPTSGFGWLGAGGVKSERASGVIAEGGSSYVPEIGRALQSDFIVPPGADAEGSASGAPYVTHVSAEDVAAELAWGAGAPGREAGRQEEKKRHAEEEAEEAAELGSAAGAQAETGGEGTLIEKRATGTGATIASNSGKEKACPPGYDCLYKWSDKLCADVPLGCTLWSDEVVVTWWTNGEQTWGNTDNPSAEFEGNSGSTGSHVDCTEYGDLGVWSVTPNQCGWGGSDPAFARKGQSLYATDIFHVTFGAKGVGGTFKHEIQVKLDRWWWKVIVAH